MHTIITTGSLQTATLRGIGVRRRSLSIDAGSREVLLDDRAVDLTRTEFDLLHVLSKNPRQVFTPRQARLSPDLAVTQIDSTLAELVGIPDADCLGRPFPELVESLAG